MWSQKNRYHVLVSILISRIKESKELELFGTMKSIRGSMIDITLGLEEK